MPPPPPSPPPPLPHGQAFPVGGHPQRFPIGWIAKQVVLPLAPFFVAAGLRAILCGPSLRIFDPGEVFFSLAMLAILLLISIGRLVDLELRDALGTVAALAALSYVALFTTTVILKVQSEQHLWETIEHAKAEGDDHRYEAAHHTIAQISPRSEEIIDTLRIIAIVLFAATIPGAVYCRQRYKLTE